MGLPGVDVDRYKVEVERDKKEKADIKADAQKLEAVSVDREERSDEQLHPHHRWAQAITSERMAASLAAITLLTRKKWLEYTSYGFVLVGVALGVIARLHF